MGSQWSEATGLLNSIHSVVRGHRTPEPQGSGASVHLRTMRQELNVDAGN